MNKKAGMLIGELEKRSGIRRSTIHHYLQYGLLHRPQKTGKTMAYYDESHIQRLNLIQKIKLDFIKSTKTSRVPLDFVKHKINEGYTLSKDKSFEATPKKPEKGEKAKRKKEEIIEAALKLYEKRGYYLTSIRDIINEVGISFPTFYYYFANKREFFIETIEYVVRNYLRDTEEKLSAEPNKAKRSVIMFQVFYENYSKIGEILYQLRSSVAIGDPWAKDRLSKLYGEMTEDLSKRLRDNINAGIMRDVDPELLALFNVLNIENVIHLASLKIRYDINQLQLFMGEMFFRAFLTDKGKEIFRVLADPAGMEDKMKNKVTN